MTLLIGLEEVHRACNNMLQLSQRCC